MFPSSRQSRISSYLAWYDVCLFVLFFVLCGSSVSNQLCCQECS
ncbi:hypothetical protein Hanom_Chr04g00354131 [Helianthus anomalus]